MESLENEIGKYKSLLDQMNLELNELQNKYEKVDKERLELRDDFKKVDKERLELRDDFKKVSIYIQNTQKLLDEQDEITKSVNAQIAEIQKENIELKSELELKESDSNELKQNQFDEINGNISLI